MDDVHAAGAGSELWRVRVDLLTGGVDANPLVTPCADALRRLLGIDGPRAGVGDIGVDCGIGVEGQPVVGFLFWVRADDIGDAARVALDVARQAGAAAGVGPGVYDVVVIPEAVVVTRSDPHYPQMPD